MGHNVNVVAQPSELRSEAIDVSLDPANTRRIAISQQAYSQFWHLNSISASYLQALPGIGYVWIVRTITTIANAARDSQIATITTAAVQLDDLP